MKISVSKENREIFPFRNPSDIIISIEGDGYILTLKRNLKDVESCLQDKGKIDKIQLKNLTLILEESEGNLLKEFLEEEIKFYNRYIDRVEEWKLSDKIETYSGMVNLSEGMIEVKISTDIKNEKLIKDLIMSEAKKTHSVENSIVFGVKIIE